MITIHIPNNFIPERRYVVETLLHHYLGIEIEIVPRSGQINYELAWEGKSIVIKDQFFGKTVVGQSYIAADRIPEKITETTNAAFQQALLIYGDEEFERSGDKIISGLDLFAGAFFMLTRWEECVGSAVDLHARFPAQDALVVKSGCILRPIVDEYVAVLLSWLIELGYAVPPQKNKFRIVPTCDVDMPFYWLRKPIWKVLASEWKKEKKFSSFNSTLKKIKAVSNKTDADPYDQFDYMMSLAEKNGHRFTFNMLVGGISQYEGYYDLKDPEIKVLMKSFRERGHHIGLHPSYNSFLDPKLMIEEKMMLTKALNMAINTSRQHYLRFAVPGTWRHLADIGLQEDSTMGYAAEPGFRCGTSRAYPVFDVGLRKTLSLLESPLLVMDVSLRNYKKLNPEGSIALCQQIMDQVKKHDGEFVFLWHNSNLSDVEGWGEWRAVFEYLVSCR